MKTGFGGQDMARVSKRRAVVAVEGPRLVDVHVGQRVRMRRLFKGMSQSDLARALGLTFQQVQKYERGMNRVSASRLYDLSRVLEVPVSFFFDDLPDNARDDARVPSTDAVGLAEAGLSDPLAKRETAELVRAYYGISDLTLRKRVYDMIKALGDQAEGTPVLDPAARRSGDETKNGAHD